MMSSLEYLKSATRVLSSAMSNWLIRPLAIPAIILWKFVAPMLAEESTISCKSSLDDRVHCWSEALLALLASSDSSASSAARIIFSTRLAGLTASLIASPGSSDSPTASIVFPPKLTLLAVAKVTARRIPTRTVKFIFAEKKKKWKKIEKNRS